jgi:hypothetical protein
LAFPPGVLDIGTAEFRGCGKDGADGWMICCPRNQSALDSLGIGRTKKSSRKVISLFGNGERGEGIQRIGGTPFIAEIETNLQAFTQVLPCNLVPTEDSRIQSHRPGHDDGEPGVACAPEESKALVIECESGFKIAFCRSKYTSDMLDVSCQSWILVAGD